MIKLIVTDMDGTLVDSQKRVPEEIYPIVGELAERGVKFVLASGRQYDNLKLHFHNNVKDIVYIAENGGVIYENGVNIYADQMAEEDLLRLLRPIQETEGAYPIFCGINAAYIADDDPEFLQNARMYFEACVSVPDLAEVCRRDKICKIAIYDKHGSEENVYQRMKHHLDGVRGVVSAEHWMDIMNKDTNKGKAIRFLQRRYRISGAESMAFGDYLNDLEMLQVCHYGFAMANGHPSLLEASRFIAKSNDEKGVIQVIRALLDGSTEEWATQLQAGFEADGMLSI